MFNKTEILDCTLRDGSYVNNFQFNKNDTKKILNVLEDAGLKMLVMSMTSSTNDKIITSKLTIPTISFRSSEFCNGEVDLLYDLLGISIGSLTDNKRKDDNMKPSIMLNKLERFIKKIHTRKS